MTFAFAAQVDIAIDNCSGAAFAERVVATLAAGLDGGGSSAAMAASSTIGVIAANPEQSKHLETATMRLCNVEVDFVNLRSELCGYQRAFLFSRDDSTSSTRAEGRPR